MDRLGIRTLIGASLAEILDQDDVELTDDTVADDVPDWDSIAQVRLLIALESKLQIRFDAKEIGTPRTVGELVDIILAKTDRTSSPQPIS